MQIKKHSSFWAKFGLILLLSIALSWSGISQAEASLKVYFLDVDQAEATLLIGPDFTILIDAGDRGNNDVVPQLERLGVDKLDLLIFTHPHADHIGQGAAVLKHFPVEEVWMSGYEHTTKLFNDLLDAILATDAYYHEPRRGEVFNFGDLRLEILHPDKLYSDLHHTNIVMRAVYGDIAFLFTGDGEIKTENSILASGLPVQAQILQLGHHGSRTSSGIEFLIAVDPEVAIYSAGMNNDYGHPHPEVVERIVRLGFDLYGTEVFGTIVVSTDGFDYSIEVSKAGDQLKVRGVDLNTANSQDLQRIVHIGPGRAQEIIDLRKVEPFQSLDDLKRVSGLGEKRIQEIKEQGIAYVKE